MSNFDKVIDPLLKAEGGMRIHKDEPGGASNMGVSLIMYRAYYQNPNLTIADLGKMLVPEAKDIYRKLFWDQMMGDHIESALVAKLAFDQLVNRGISNFRMLVVECLVNRYNVAAATPQARWPDLWTCVNDIPERAFFRRLVADAQHSYREIAFDRIETGTWTPEEANATLKVWMVRTHNLLKLLE